MTSENIKDLRNMADMLAKDYQRLADDMRAMRDCLSSILVELAIMEDNKSLMLSILERSKENKEKNG